MRKRIFMIKSTRANRQVPIGSKNVPAKQLLRKKRMIKATDHGKKKAIR